MVGFGSSLRMARRPGWEEAYLNYEALKLLLTQIEAVYEEEAHLQHQRRQNGGDGGLGDGGLDFDLRDLDVMFVETPDRRGRRRDHPNNHQNQNRPQQQQQQQHQHQTNSEGGEKRTRDYRDELFLESDSDAAFESLMKYDAYSAEEAASDLEQQQQQMDFEQQLASLHSMQQQQQQQQQQSPRGARASASMAGHNNNNFDRQDHSNAPGPPQNAFASHENYDNHFAGRHGDYDSDDTSQGDYDNNCVPSFGRRKKKGKQHSNNKNNAQDRLRSNPNPHPYHRSNPNTGRGASFLSPAGGKSKPDAFILDNNNDDDDDDDDDARNNDAQGYTQFDTTGMTTLTSFGQTIQTRQIPFGRNNNNINEMAPLVPTTPGSVDSPLYSFGVAGPITPPPVDSFLRTGGDPTSLLQMPNIDDRTDNNNNNNNNLSLKLAAVSNTVSAPSHSMSNKTQMIKHLEEERKQERRKRRQKKRQRAERRKALERKVPRHIRCSHTKAREITQRFLGLLRAECEKVMLFAQSRLGELADTAGSLRFPAMEGHHYHHHQNNHGVQSTSSLHQHGLTSHGSGIYESAPLSPSGSGTAGASRGTVGSYDYPLSEGGMHSSASSSSDDGLGGSDWFDWSASSSDSVDSNNSGSPRMARSLSAFRDMQEGRQPIYDHDHRHSKAKSGSDSQRHHETSSPNKKHDGFTSAKRHLDHFEKIRRNRPIFQRNGNIMGEDLLLLSAVDEADGYTAVGVELMHVLRFISVNLIAVRKICRKHDRLLMNRMLGGYYQHLKMLAMSESNNLLRSQEFRDNGATKNRPQAYQDAHVQNAQALGGILARESGDIFETHHPAVIGQVNNYKLVGLYDANLQQLANSRTVQVISSCLVLALSEYEVSRSRANALATLNTHSGIPPPRPGNGAQTIFRLKHQQNQPGANPHALMKSLNEGNEVGGADSDEEGGPPSTASSISLTRLRFAVTSIIALREAARRKKDFYSTYLSRSMLAFTGRAVVGEGLDGCSRETLDFLVAYNPDAALLMDPASLNDGLKQGMWSKRSISSVMASSLAVATTPVDLPHDLISKSLYQQERKVKRAVNLLPSIKMIEVPELFKGHSAKKSTSALAILESDCFRSILRLNRASHFLYTMNYFIVHPTTITFITAIGSPGAHSALVIGAPSVAALLSALLHCYILSGGSKAPMASVSSLRWLFLIAACFGVAGNAGHVYGVWENSISYAILGRFVMGFSCSEILNRNIVAGFLPVHGVVTETAILVHVQVLGMLLGLTVGTLAEFLPFRIAGWGTRSLSSSSWLMGLLWFIHLIHVCICFRVEDGDAKRRLEANNTAEVEQLLTKQKASLSLKYDSDSTGSLQGKRSNSSHNIHASLRLTYGATDDIDIKPGGSDDTVDPPAAVTTRKQPQKQGKGRKRRMRTLRSFPARLRRLLNYSIGVPVCLFIILYIKFALEVLLSSCPMILDRYFQWGGGRAGIFLSGLTLTILPVNFICGHIARKHEERTVLKKCVLVLGTGLVAMINYGSFLELALQIKELMSETEDKQRGSQYDWLVGIIQYFVGFTVTFFGLTALDSAALSLLSKVSPPRLRTSSASLQLGTIVTFVTLLARVIADLQILMIGLSHRLINTDLVNSLVLPLLLGCFVIGHFVRKHFFFLM